MSAPNRFKLFSACLGLLLAGLILAAPAQAGTMKAYVCAKINSDASYARNYGYMNDSTNLAANSGWMFDFTVNGTVPSSADVKASTLAGTYTYDGVTNPLSSLGNGIVPQGRAVVSNYCSGKDYATDSGTFSYVPEYYGPGVRSAPQSSCPGDEPHDACIEWQHAYGIADGANMARLARAVGTSRITGVSDLWGVSIVSGEGWRTYLQDSANSSANVLDNYLKCAPGSTVDDSTTMNPSSFQHDDTGDSTPNTNAYYQCELHLLAPTSASDSTSSMLLFICDTRVYESGTVKCEKSKTNSDSAWSTRTKSLSRNIALPSVSWFGSVADCDSNWRETGSTNTCYTGPPHNRYCNEHIAVADTPSNQDTYNDYKARTAHGLHSCSWNAGIWLGGDSPTVGNSTGYLTVSDSVKPTVSPPVLNATQSCDGWYSLPCFQNKTSSTGTSFDIEASIPATHELGINRTFIGINRAPDTTVDSEQLVYKSRKTGSSSVATITKVEPGTPSAGKVTYTTSSSHGFIMGQTVAVSGVLVGGSSNNGFNGSKTISAVPTTKADCIDNDATTCESTSFVVDDATTGTTTLSSAKADPTDIIGSSSASSITTVESGAPSAGKVTYTTSTVHGFVARQAVSIGGILVDGSSNNGFNGTKIISSIPTSKTFVVDNPTTGTTTLSSSAKADPSTVPGWSSSCKGALGGTGSATQSCYQPCARHITGGTAGANYADSDILGFGAMVPCLGSSNDSANNDTVLAAKHLVPMFRNGALSTPFQTGTNSLQAAAIDPTGNSTTQTTATQLKIDDALPGLGPSSLASCNTSTGGPAATVNTGVNSSYWNLSSPNLIPLKGYACDAQSGIKASRMYYQLCSANCENEANWKPTLTAATITGVAGGSPSSGKATYTTSAAHNFDVGDVVKISGIYVGGSAANNYNAAKATITAVTSTTFTVDTSQTGTVTLSGAKADPVGSDFTGTVTGTVSQRQLSGSSSSVGLSQSGSGCANLLSSPVVSSSVALPASGSTCSFSTSGLASGSKARFWIAAQDAAYNIALSPVGSVVTMDGGAPLVQSPASGCASGNGAPVKVTTSDGTSTKTGTADGYWGSNSENYMFVSANSCDAISGINKAEIHYQTCPSTSACTNASDWTPSITTANASSIMGTQTGGTDSARLSSTGCAREIASTTPGQTVEVPDTSSTAKTCKFKATNLNNGDRVRFVNVALDGAGIYAVSDPSSTYIIDNDTPVSLDPASPACGTSGYPMATTSSGATKTGSVAGYWSPALQSSMNLNAAACDTFSGVGKMEIHYQTCTPSSSDACASNSTNWTPSIKTSSWGTQMGGTSSNRLDNSCTRTIATPASNSVATLPPTKSLTNSDCKLLATGLADNSKIRFVLLAQDGAGNSVVSSPSSALSIDGTDPKTVATNAASCTTAADPGVGVSRSGGATKTGTADGYWSPVVASQMLLQSAGCDSHSGVVKAEMHYQTCAANADCSNPANWTPTVNSSTADQTSSSASDQSKRLSGSSDCVVDVATPTGGSRVNVPPGSSSGCKFLTTGLADGSKVRFMLFNTDAAGNTNASAPSSEYTIDGSPPGSSSLSAKKYNPNGATEEEKWTTLDAESGSSKTWTNTTKVRIIWDNSSDLSGVVSAKTAYTPGSCSTVTEDPVSGTSKDFEQDRSQECRQGQHIFNMWAKDGAGNQTPDASPATLKFHYDSDPTVESTAAYSNWSVLSALQPQKLQPQSFTTLNGAVGCTPGATSSSTYGSSNSFTMCWINPNIDAAALGNTIAPIKAVHFRVGGDEVQTVTKPACLIPGNTCSINTSEAPGLSVPSNGSHPVTVWLEDQAGNSDLKQSVAGNLKLFLTNICP